MDPRRRSGSEAPRVFLESRDHWPQNLEILVATHVGVYPRHLLIVGDGAHRAFGEDDMAVAVCIIGRDHKHMAVECRTGGTQFAQLASPA